MSGNLLVGWRAGADGRRDSSMTARKTVAIDDILGVAEVLELAGVTNRRVLSTWREEKQFPDPIREPKCGPLWDRQAVLRWLERHRSNGR